MGGYAKVSDLLKDERFAAVCAVTMERSGYVVAKTLSQVAVTMERSRPKMLKSATVPLEAQTATLPMDEEQPKISKSATFPMEASESTPMDEAQSFLSIDVKIRNTFIHIAKEPSTPVRRTRRFSTMPANALKSICSDICPACPSKAASTDVLPS